MTQKRKARDLDSRFEQYCQTAKLSKRKTCGRSRASMVGFTAAAAVGLFTAGQAEADIVYQVDGRSFKIGDIPVNPLVSGLSVDMDNNGKFDFYFAGLNRGASVNSTQAIFNFSSYNLNGGVFKQSTNASSFYSRLRAFASGSTIGARTSNSQGVGNAALGFAGGFGNNIFNIPAGGSGTGIIGGVFTSKSAATGTVPIGQEYFAWMRIRISVDSSGVPLESTLIDWAYEDSGGSIVAGVVPEPSSAGVLGLVALAMGSSGLRRRRRMNPK